MKSDAELPWPSAEEYGLRFKKIDEKIERALALLEYRNPSDEKHGVLRYRLAKIAIASEDARRAISALESASFMDDALAQAMMELRSACMEVRDSFEDMDALLVDLQNYLDA